MDHFDILVLQDLPAFDQEPVRIVIAPGYVAQITFSDQPADYRRRCPDQPLGGVTPKIVRIAIRADNYTVDRDPLADVAGDEGGIIAAFPEVVIFPFGRA